MSELTEQFIHEMRSLSVNMHTWVRGRELKNQHWDCAQCDTSTLVRWSSWKPNGTEVQRTLVSPDGQRTCISCPEPCSKAEHRVTAVPGEQELFTLTDREHGWWNCHCGERLKIDFSFSEEGKWGENLCSGVFSICLFGFFFFPPLSYHPSSWNTQEFLGFCVDWGEVRWFCSSFHPHQTLPVTAWVCTELSLDVAG